MGRRSKAPPSVVGAPAATQAGPRDYKLPGDRKEDQAAWRALLLPFAGRLLLTPGPRRKLSKVVTSVKCALGRESKPITAIDVWLHCGLHYRTACDGGVAPVSGLPFPTEDGAKWGWHFIPLRRDAPDGTRHFNVRTESAGGGSTGARTAAGSGAGTGRWRVQVSSLTSPPAFATATFEAESKDEADEWARQLTMRATPLSVVWQRGLGGAQGGGRSVAGPSSRPFSGGAGLMAKAIESFVGSDGPTAVTGVVTAALCDDVFDLATSASVCATFVVGTLSTVVRVCAVTAAMSGIAAELQVAVEELSHELRSRLFPAVTELEKVGSSNAVPLRDKLSEVAAVLDALVGRLLHLSLSKGAGLREAAIVSGEIESLSPVKEVTECKAAVKALWDTTAQDAGTSTLALVGAAHRRAHEADEGVVREAVAWVKIPEPSGPIVAKWSLAHAHQPWCQLLEMVLREAPPAGSGMCACAVSAHGMGGVGKTTACALVARRVAASDKDGGRYGDGVYWVQLSQKAGEAEAKKYLLALATAVSGKKVTAPSIDAAADRLRDALADKAVLVVVDDCWAGRLAEHFLRAVRDSRCCRCCLLFSTRTDHIARQVTGADHVVHIEPLKPEAGKDMLLSYALGRGQSASPPSGENEHRACSELLKAAAGLPLALALLGSLVGADGWTSAAEQLDDALADGSVSRDSRYPTLWQCFRASYNQLGIDHNESHQRLFRALCVVEKQESLPLSALAALWGIDETRAGRRARYMASVKLIEKRSESSGTRESTFGLHDLLIDWIRDDLVEPVNREGFHAALVNNYASTLSLAVVDREPCRRWWKVPAGGYMERTLCRHLGAAGSPLREELGALVCDMRWIDACVKRSGGTAVAYRSDSRVSGVALLERVATVVERALGAAAELGIPADANMQLVAFEVNERLRGVSRCAGPDDGVLRRLRESANQYLRRPSIELMETRPLPLPQELSFCRGHRAAVLCSCALRDTSGKTLVVSGSDDNTLRVWDAGLGECVHVPEGHSARVTCVCEVEVDAGGDGVDGGGKVQRVVSGSDDNTLRVWDAGLGECVHVLEGHSDPVTCVCVVEVDAGGDGVDGGGKVQRVVSGSVDNTLRMWDAVLGECVHVMEGHSDPVTCVCVVEVDAGGDGVDGGGKVQRVVSGSDDDTLRVWDSATDGAFVEGRVLPLRSCAMRLTPCCARPGLVLCRCVDELVRLVDTCSGRVDLLVFPFRVRPIGARARAPGQLLLASNGRVNLARVLLV